MKKTVQKFLSLFLAVCMLMGCVILIAPETVTPVSADGSGSSVYTNVPANTTVMVNGINVRYDRYSGNNDGYVHVFSDGTIEFKIRHGDMVWFPDLVMTDSSEVHAEFTVLEGTYQHTGVAFNVASDGAGSWASTNVVGFNNGARVRVSGATKAQLGDNNGNDGYGNGGVKRPIDGYITVQSYIDSGKAFPAKYNYVKNADNEVAVGKTVAVDLKRADGKVCVDWSAVGYGAFYSDWYTDSLDANTSYLYAGGSVGYSVLYQDYNNDYITRRIEKLTVSNCTIGGIDRTFITLAGFVNVPPNTNFAYNGRTYRLDVYDCPSGDHSDSYAHILPNGTIELNLHHGDMLWFPDVQMTATTAIHAEVTAGMNMTNRRSGVAYAVRPNGSGVWANCMIAVMNTASRLRITAATYANLTQVSGNDHGMGGTTRAYNDAGSQSAYYNTQAYKYIESNTTNHDWGKNKTLSFDISNSSGTVSVSWGNPNIGSFATKSYTTASSSDYSYTGAVGYTVTNVDTAADNSVPVVIERLTVTNCTVGGSSTATWNAVGKEMAAHTNTTVNGVVYRFDPLASHTTSSCWIMDDNTFRVRLSAGDLFWLPETSGAEHAMMTAKMIANNGQANSGNLAAGIAYNINTGANSTWGDSSDSLNSAHLQTSWRRRVGYTTVGGANSSMTKLGTYSTDTLAEGSRNSAYLGMGDRWNIRDIVKTDLSVSSGVLNFSFRNENNVQMNYDSYTIGSGDNSAYKVMNGPLGFYVFWDGDNSERYSMTVDILTLADEITPEYHYELDFSKIEDMTLTPGYNLVRGHALYYIKNSGAGKAYISGGKLYLEGANSDMILFDDLNVDGLAVTSEVYMTYLNDPGSTGFLGYLHNLSDAFENINVNGADFATGTLVRTGSISAVNLVKTVAAFYKFSTGATYRAPYQQYNNGAEKTTNVSVGTEINLRTYTGVSGMGDGKIAFNATGWSYGSGNNYTHSAGYQKGPHGLAFSAGGAADGGAIKVSISKISITAKGEMSADAAYSATAGMLLPTGLYVNLKDTNTIFLSYPTSGGNNRVFVTGDGDLIVRMNPGTTFKATNLSSNTWTKLDAGNTTYPNSATVTWDGEKLSCSNAGATVVIRGYSFRTENEIYNGSANLSLDGLIKFNFTCDVNAFMYSDAKLVARKGGEIIAEKTLTDCYSPSSGKYILPVPVAAKEMMDSITFRVERNGSQIEESNSYTQSVKNYADALVASDSSWADLMDAMLNYGAAAQVYFTHNTSNLPKSTSGVDYNASSVDYNASDVTAMAYTNKSYLVEDRIGLTVTLDSGTNLNLYVRPRHYYDQNATVTAASAVNSSSVATPVTLSMNGDFWQITISDLKAEDLNERFTFTVVVKDDSGTHNVEITCSALNWVKSIINSSTATANAKTLAKALGTYAAEAEKKA